MIGPVKRVDRLADHLPYSRPDAIRKSLCARYNPIPGGPDVLPCPCPQEAALFAEAYREAAERRRMTEYRRRLIITRYPVVRARLAELEREA